MNGAAVQKHQKVLSHINLTQGEQEVQTMLYCFRETQCPCKVFCDVCTQKPETRDSPHSLFGLFGVQSQIIISLNIT